ncbi:MAG: hypothetical protein IJ050_11200, partial [Clostridia bacterium]|nr:hypothetical protein [Clostridia bacterium]
MSKKYPELERGTSSQITGRTYIPTQLYKHAKSLHKQEKKIIEAIDGIGIMNMKQNKAEVEKLVEKYMTDRADLLSKLSVYDETMKQMRKENADLKKESKTSVTEKLEMKKRQKEFEELKSLVANIPHDILELYKSKSQETQIQSHEKS